MRKQPRLRLALAVLWCLLSSASAHKNSAGSCNSPRSDHHGRGSPGNGSYVLTVHPKHGTIPTEVLFRLKSRSDHTFRGFQIICESCVFLNLPKDDAQLNEKYCPRRGGRVTHTNNADKKRVEIEARLELNGQTEITVTYFVVRTLHDWYGPLHLTLDAEGTVLSRTVGPSTESTFSSSALSLPSLGDDDSEDDDQGEDDDDGVRLATADDDDGESNDNGQEFDDDEQVVANSCQQSTESDFTCMAKVETTEMDISHDWVTQLKDFFWMHWSILNETQASDPTSQTRLEILLEVETRGWASLGFAGIKGKMHPADAVLGWVEEDGTPNIHSYHIERDDVTAGNQNRSLFEIYSINRQGSKLNIRFAKYIDRGIIPVDLDKGVFLNYAISKDNQLTIHNQWGSVELDFKTGKTETVSSRKYYQTHGSLMVLAWIVFVPLSMTVARSKWSPSGMGVHGWLDLHRGLHVFAAIALVVALIVAVINFQSIHTRTGRVHRLLGILISLFFFAQILMGILRPKPGSLHRPLFVTAHRWGGRSLLLLASINVFIGISAFHMTTGSSASPWITSVVLLLVVQFCIALYFELGFGRPPNRSGEVAEIDMVQIPYARPGEHDSDEHYTSD